MTKFLSDNDKEFIWSNSGSAINMMTEYEVVPTPQNYQLWYTHTAQSDLNLSKVIDGMITKKMPFNEELNEKLYDKFFAENRHLICRISLRPYLSVLKFRPIQWRFPRNRYGSTF